MAHRRDDVCLSGLGGGEGAGEARREGCLRPRRSAAQAAAGFWPA